MRVWKPAIRQTRRSALRHRLPSFLGRVLVWSVRAAPAPILRPRAQSGRDRVIPHVSANACLLLVVTNPVVVRLRLPERRLPQSEKRLCPPGAVLLPTPEDVPQHL